MYEAFPVSFNVRIETNVEFNAVILQDVGFCIVTVYIP
jgi:hypothetical protein